MKSVEFLIVLFLLFSTFAFLYKNANELKRNALTNLDKFNRSIQRRLANSLISNLINFGEPFEKINFNADPDLVDIQYNPITQKFTYNTYSRW